MKCLALFLKAKREEEGPRTRSADEVIFPFWHLLWFVATFSHLPGVCALGGSGEGRASGNGRLLVLRSPGPWNRREACRREASATAPSLGFDYFVDFWL